MKREQKTLQKGKAAGASQKTVEEKANEPQSITEYIKSLEKSDMKVFGVSEDELATQLAMMGKDEIQMNGVSKALDRNDDLLILDGGTITGMQELGVNLHKVNELWQLQFMHHDPLPIQKTHERYYESGADIAITATYNARTKYSRFLNKAVELAVNAKNEVLQNGKPRDLLIAGACGPYGSAARRSLEYDGSYGSEVSQKFLEQQHSIKLSEFVKNQDVDVIAYETIPCLKEVRAILNVLKSKPGAKAWICVSCKNATQLNNGESLKDFVQMVEKHDKDGQVEALGVNCSDPKYTTTQIKMIRTMTSRAIIVYPNNGGKWDSKALKWVKDDSCDSPESFAKEALKWKKYGGRIIIGGCCRTHFKWIEELKKALRDSSQHSSAKNSNTKESNANKRLLGKKRQKSSGPSEYKSHGLFKLKKKVL